MSSDKTTEIYDLLCDLTYPDGRTRADYLNTYIPEGIYDGILVSYNSNTKRWRVKLPLTNYEFTYVGFKAFKPIPLSSNSAIPNIFYCCSAANNTSKRVAFDYSNLTDGVEISPLNGITDLEFWIYNPIDQIELGIKDASEYYYNLILELDFYIRK